MAKVISFSCPEWVEQEIINKKKRRSEWITKLIIKDAFERGKDNLYKLLCYNNYFKVDTRRWVVI